MSSRECCGPSLGTNILEAVEQKSARTIALVGPPNCGKTTLFNQLTGLNRKVANFPGVTVEHFTGYLTLQDGARIALIDLPGIYSLNAKSEDERVTVDVLRGRMNRNRAAGRHCAGARLDQSWPSPGARCTGDRPRPAYAGAAQHGRFLARPQRRYRCAIAGETVRHARRPRQRRHRGGSGGGRPFHLLGHAAAATGRAAPLHDIRACRQWAERINIESSYRKPLPPVWTRRLDAFYLHRLWGPLIFLAVVVGIFQTIFAAGQPLSQLLQDGLDYLGTAAACPHP